MKILAAISLSCLFLSCSKFEIEKVEGNKPPSEQLVTAQLRENYINRLYITLAGRKSTPMEFEQALNLMGEAALQKDREKIIFSIFALPEYNDELYAIARADYLESVDTNLIELDYFNALNFLYSTTGNVHDYWVEVVRQLKNLSDIPKQLDAGQIEIVGVHERLVDNPYYDQINMGSENYVVATFQNFLFRYPTKVELENGKNMVDGFPGSLFLEAGKSRPDFIGIFFKSDDYYEGQVINLFRKYLFRDPDTREMVELTTEFRTSGDYQGLQRKILSSDEYFFN